MTIETASEICLSQVDFETGCGIKSAFGRKNVVTRDCLSKYCARTAKVHYFVQLGLLAREGSDLRTNRVATVSERQPLRTSTHFMKQNGLPGEERAEVWRVINAFNPSQLELFRVILGNTKFPDSCGSNIIKLKPVKEAGHCKQEVIDLINQLGEFNPHIGSKTIVKKREA